MDKFYEQFKNQCPFCKQYLCFRQVKENNIYRWYSCASCGFKRKKKIVFAHFKHKKGKTFLKTQEHDFLEVEIKNKNGVLQVAPIIENLKLL